MRAIVILLCALLLAGCARKQPAKEAPAAQDGKPAVAASKPAPAAPTAPKSAPGDVLGLRTPAEVTATEKLFRELSPGYYSSFKAAKTGKPFLILKHEDGRAGFVTETAQGLTYVTAEVRMLIGDFIVFSRPTPQPVSERIRRIYSAAKAAATETPAKAQLIGALKAGRAKAAPRPDSPQDAPGADPAAEPPKAP